MVVSLSRCRFSWRALPACLAILIGAGLLVLPAQAQTIAPKDAVGRRRAMPLPDHWRPVPAGRKGAETKRTAYGAGTPEERRAILDELAGVPLPSPSDLLPRATWRDAEWYLTARELCGLLLELRDAPALNGSPEPLVAVEGWRWTGYKGGSEVGVLNLSAAGITADGRVVCAILTANGDRLQPEDRLARLFSTLFRSAEKSR
ncbi:hypothetical protein FH063_001765 [Azospirillum argentinense]|uniref:Beta-lactamase family protein n=2 Tax=Azospirillum argentinense TaxID=2970906 RepID=A0A5B0KXW7_9PROT|nr:hypothetical protein FH063_001765 [Azospirillum argentinense]